MRFKKGSKVEVFSSKEVPYGSWQRVEIISGNGHTYSVRYDSSPFARDEVIVGRVSRKKLRPCPPYMGVERWETGELVEVFDDLSWKVATVLKNISRNYYLVRQIGTRREFAVHKVEIRVRQSWQDDKWFVIGQRSGSTKSTRPSGSDVYQKLQADSMLEVSPGDYSSALLNNTVYQESNVSSATFLKRACPFRCSDYAESCTGNPRKRRSIEQEAQQQWCPSSSLKKVDAVAYPQKNLGKIYMHDSFNYHTNGYCEMTRVKSNCVPESTRAGKSEANDYASDACSVGSCSVICCDEISMRNCILDGSSLCADSLSSDAESFCDRGDEEKWNHSLGEDEGARIHRFELDTYRSSLEALFASGPLSWEQEASLTDLRLSLKISDDEHLTELRNLISSRTINQVGPMLEAWHSKDLTVMLGSTTDPLFLSRVPEPSTPCSKGIEAFP